MSQENQAPRGTGQQRSADEISAGEAVQTWRGDRPQVLTTGDLGLADDLFGGDPWWRDLVAMTSRRTAGRGADVTLVQRYSTYIMSQKNGIPLLFTSICSEEGQPTEDADLLNASFPLTLAEQSAEPVTRAIAVLDADLLKGLE